MPSKASSLRKLLPASFTDYRKTLPQYLIPKRLLSQLMHALTRVRWRAWKTWQIDWFIRRYKVDMTLAKNPDPHSYVNFNSFFTRELRSGARIIAGSAGEIACPVDGSVSQVGAIDDTRIFQAKGHYYHLEQLLGGSAARAQVFKDGQFASLYLAPKDYHRIHMPCSGRLREMIYVPGHFFGVNASTACVVPGLFARNERVICIFDTDAGPMALILVGALFVASMETVWAGVVTSNSRNTITVWDYHDTATPVVLEHGAEMGRFNMGSTVIVLFAQGSMQWDAAIKPAAKIQMGQVLGRVNMSNVAGHKI
ncbi:MAG: archaetidylserine decarboxylase [Gammaproteobacteria bacterium]